MKNAVILNFLEHKCYPETMMFENMDPGLDVFVLLHQNEPQRIIASAEPHQT